MAGWGGLEQKLSDLRGTTPAGLAEQVQVGEDDVEHEFVEEVRDLHLSVVRDPLMCCATPSCCARDALSFAACYQPALSDPKLCRV